MPEFKTLITIVTTSLVVTIAMFALIQEYSGRQERIIRNLSGHLEVLIEERIEFERRRTSFGFDSEGLVAEILNLIEKVSKLENRIRLLEGDLDPLARPPKRGQSAEKVPAL